MAMLTVTVDKDDKLIDVEKSKEKGLFENKKDQEYANKILKKLKKLQASSCKRLETNTIKK